MIFWFSFCPHLFAQFLIDKHIQDGVERMVIDGLLARSLIPINVDRQGRDGFRQDADTEITDVVYVAVNLFTRSR